MTNNDQEPVIDINKLREEDKILYAKKLKGVPDSIHPVKFIRDGVLYEIEVRRVCINELNSGVSLWD